MIELKPCPCCGSEEILAEINNIEKKFEICCEECDIAIATGFNQVGLNNGGFISFYEMEETMKKLTDKWNRRTNNE